jgi:hypothetical protein
MVGHPFRSSKYCQRPGSHSRCLLVDLGVQSMLIYHVQYYVVRGRAVKRALETVFVPIVANVGIVVRIGGSIRFN